MPRITTALTPDPYSAALAAVDPAAALGPADPLPQPTPTRRDKLLAQMAGAAPLLHRPAPAGKPGPRPAPIPKTAVAAARARHANLLAQLNRARGRVKRLTARLVLVAATLGSDVDRRRKLPAALTL